MKKHKGEGRVATLTREQIAAKVKKAIVERTAEDPNKIDDNYVFRDNLDSLDIVETIMALEDVFGIHISDSEAEGILSFVDAVNFIEKRLSS